MENANESYIYIIKDQFFDDFDDPYLRGNEDENRPHYYCLRKDNLLWMIPLSRRYEKYKGLYDKDIEKYHRCDKFHFIRIKGDQDSVFLIQDIFPITEEYIEKEYCVNGIPYQIMNENLRAEIIRKAERILFLTRRGIKFNPTQPDILKIEKELLAKTTQSQVAAVKENTEKD